MGYRAKLFTGAAGVSEHAGAQSAPDLVIHRAASAPKSAGVLRDDQASNFTLDTDEMPHVGQRVAPEQIVMGALLLLSFVAPLWHLLG